MADTIVRKVLMQLTADDMDASAKIEAIKAKADELKADNPELSVRIDTASASAQMSVFRQELKDAATVTASVDDADAAAKIDALKAKIDELKASSANVKVSEDDKDATARLLAFKARLDELSAKVVSPKFDASGIAKTEAEVAGLDAELDRLNSKQVNPGGGGGGGGIMGMMQWPAIIAGVGAALPVIPAGLAAVSAAAGTGALAITSVTKALSDASAASQQTGQSSAQLAQTELSNATAIASAQKAIADAKTQSAHDQITSDQQIASAEQSLADAQTTAAHDQITSAQQVASAQQSLADAQRTAAQDAVTSAQQVASAEQSLRTAEQSEQNAQESLTQAREQAKLTLEQLNNAQVDGALQAQRAAFNLQDAQLNQQQTDASATSTALQKAEAAQSVAEAQQALLEAQQNATNATNAANTANQEGVDGLPAVVSAQQAAAQAAQGVANAQQSLANASQQAAQQQQRDAETIANAQQSLANAQQQQAWQQQKDAEQVANAQQSLANAQQQASWTQQKDAEAVAAAVDNLSNTYKQQQAAAAATAASSSTASASFAKDMAGMSLAGQGVVNQLLEMKKDLAPLENTAQTAIFPGVLTFLKGVQSLYPTVAGEVKAMGGILGDAFSAAGKAMESSGFKKDLDEIFGEGNGLLKTILPALGKVVGAFMDMGAKSGSAVSGFASGAASILGGVADMFTQLGNPETAAAIGSVFRSLGKIIGDLGGPLGALIGALAKGLAPILAPLVGPIGTLADAVTRLLNAMPPPLLSAITGGLIGVWLGFQAFTLLTSPITLVALAVVGVATAIYELVKHWSTVSGAFKQGWADVEQWTKDAADFITHTFDTVRHWFASIGDDIARPFIDGFDAVVSWLNSSGNAISGFFESLPGKIVGWLNSTGNDISKPFIDGFDIVIRYFEQLPGSLATLGRNAVIGLYNGIAGFIGNVWGFFEKLPGQIMGWLSGLYNSMLALGTNIVIGIWNGIVSGFNQFISGISNIGHDIANALGAPFGIHFSEPSEATVMVRAGQNITQGLAKGIAQGQSAVHAAMLRTDQVIGTAAPSGTGVPQKLQLEFVGNANDPLWQLFKKNIRVRGGNVQVVGA